jgi:antitoxin HicB
MRFPMKIEPDEEFFMVTFPDIPEAITQGESLEQARAVAQDALETALEFYFEEPRLVPKPSRIKAGEEYVELPASVSAKVLLLNEMIKQKVRPAELARRLETTPQEVNRLTDLRHATKIDRIAGAMKALGKTLEIRVV